jgi:hypothetical protein
METFQRLTDDYIQKSKGLTISERLEFLEEYRLLLSENIFTEKQNQYLKDWASGKNPSS